MQEIDENSGPTAFLDNLVKSVHGLRKVYINDRSGAILAESSAPRSETDEFAVRSIPNYTERLSKLSYGPTKSIVVESDDSIFVSIESHGFLISFICDVDANVSLLSEFPNEMDNFLTQLKSFSDN